MKKVCVFFGGVFIIASVMTAVHLLISDDSMSAGLAVGRFCSATFIMATAWLGIPFVLKQSRSKSDKLRE